MTTRKVAAAATAERILDATLELFWRDPGKETSLEEVAERAGVSVQTVIRRFGGKDGLIAAAGERESERVRAQRDQALPGEPAGAVRVLTEHYERYGDRVLRMLAEEQRNPQLRKLADRGRSLHREWCARVFAPALTGRSPTDRKRRLAMLVAVADVYTWKLLRRDGGLGRRQTERALLELLEPILEGS
jgi:AcrR family transcriptional regulator